MTDSGDPPRKGKRAKRKEPDFVIDPQNPNKTIELETADLLQLGQAGIVEAVINNKTRPLSLSDLEELRDGAPIDEKVIVELGPDPQAPSKEQTVFVDFGPEPAAPSATTSTAPASLSAGPSAPMSAPAVQHARAQRASTPAHAAPPTAHVHAAESSSAPRPIPAQAAHAAQPSPHAQPTPLVPATQPSTVQPAPVIAQASARSIATPIPVTAVTPKPDARPTAPHVLGAPRRGGMGIVVVVYLVAIAALGVSIYLRWFAA